MTSPAFERPLTLDAALETLGRFDSDAKVLAGGTALVLMMRQGLLNPERLIDVSRVPGLDSISETDGGILIGATTSLATVARSDLIRRHYPSLATACGIVGNQRVRNAATIGGNLCEADYASDPPSVLASLDAKCLLSGPTGHRSVEAGEFITGYYETAIREDELLTGVFLPLPDPGTYSTYIKFRTRSSEDRACVGVAASVAFAAQSVSKIRVVIGAVSESPQSVPSALGQAIGTELAADVIQGIARGYADAIVPLSDARGSAEYRTRMIEVNVERALSHIRRQVMA